MAVPGGFLSWVLSGYLQTRPGAGVHHLVLLQRGLCLSRHLLLLGLPRLPRELQEVNMVSMTGMLLGDPMRHFLLSSCQDSACPRVSLEESAMHTCDPSDSGD